MHDANPGCSTQHAGLGITVGQSRLGSTVDPTTLPVGFEDLRGRCVGGVYELTDLLGTGPRHVLYSGVRPETDEAIVLRLIRPVAPHEPATVARFERRVGAAERVRHPAVGCPIHSGALPDGKLYIVSDRPAGQPLERELAEEPSHRLAWADARPLLLDLVRGLGAIHASELVHGSVSPSCCWVHRADPSAPSLRLLGLGTNVAPTLDEVDPTAAETTAVGGDAIFSAPETVGGLLGDVRSDVYLVGLVAYTMLTGRPPFVGPNPFQVAAMHMNAAVPPMRDAGVEVPATVEALVREMLAKEPAERPQSMDAVEQAILGLGAHEPMGIPAPRVKVSASSSMVAGIIEVERERDAAGVEPEVRAGESRSDGATSTAQSRDDGATLTEESRDDGATADPEMSPEESCDEGERGAGASGVDLEVSSEDLRRVDAPTSPSRPARARSGISRPTADAPDSGEPAEPRLGLWTLLITVSAAVAGLGVGLLLS